MHTQKAKATHADTTLKNTKSPSNSDALESIEINKRTWVTDGAWISGVAGALMTIACAASFGRIEQLEKGMSFLGFQLTQNRADSCLAVLLFITLTMILVESIRLVFYNRSHPSAELQLSIHPAIQNKKYGYFFAHCFANYIGHMALLLIVSQFYRLAGEYGYAQNNYYYQIWFRALDILVLGYAWLGLPYACITRALKNNSEADKRDYGHFAIRIALAPMRYWQNKSANLFNEDDKKNARSLLVKMFFTPLMTVFFLDQFPFLVQNISYLADTQTGFFSQVFSDSYSLSNFNKDLFNITRTFIFSIDVALAWCGYVVATRWVGNQTVSAEPTTLGWLVCLVCYPPIQNLQGFYFNAPSESSIFAMISNQAVVTFLILLTVASFLIYMISTLVFGPRFSNLTNRGIIRKGPFAIVRHPAYASKNFAWWCVMFPAIVYNATHAGWSLAITQILGMVLMTWIYYMRAITEERHLMQDPYYVAYVQKVKYRFIPGVL